MFPHVAHKIRYEPHKIRHVGLMNPYERHARPYDGPYEYIRCACPHKLLWIHKHSYVIIPQHKVDHFVMCQSAHHLFGAMQAENCMRACPTTCIFSKGDAPAAENALHKTGRHNPRNANKVLEAADWPIKKWWARPWWQEKISKPILLTFQKSLLPKKMAVWKA